MRRYELPGNLPVQLEPYRLVVLVVGHVAGDRYGPAAQLLGQLGDRVGPAGHEDERCALAREDLRDGAADPLGRDDPPRADRVR